jgi:hypothetical protein
MYLDTVYMGVLKIEGTLSEMSRLQVCVDERLFHLKMRDCRPSEGYAAIRGGAVLHENIPFTGVGELRHGPLHSKTAIRRTHFLAISLKPSANIVNVPMGKGEVLDEYGTHLAAL